MFLVFEDILKKIIFFLTWINNMTAIIQPTGQNLILMRLLTGQLVQDYLPHQWFDITGRVTKITLCARM